MHAHGLHSKDNTSYSGVEVDAEEFEELDHLRRQVLDLTYSTVHCPIVAYLPYPIVIILTYECLT